jgi:hypothetical protein
MGGPWYWSPFAHICDYLVDDMVVNIKAYISTLTQFRIPNIPSLQLTHLRSVDCTMSRLHRAVIPARTLFHGMGLRQKHHKRYTSRYLSNYTLLKARASLWLSHLGHTRQCLHTNELVVALGFPHIPSKRGPAIPTHRLPGLPFTLCKVATIIVHSGQFRQLSTAREHPK